jgi:uncharacterized protein YjgD (DUF1641 family)
MAQPITLELPKRDAREELRARLEEAPIEHAEAMLAGFEVLQGLHDQGVLELLRGVLGEKIVDIAVDAANTPESIRGIRNLMILTKTLGSIDPEMLDKFARAIPAALEGAAKAQQEDPPGFWKTVGILQGAALRRGLATLNGFLEAIYLCLR